MVRMQWVLVCRALASLNASRAGDVVDESVLPLDVTELIEQGAFGQVKEWYKQSYQYHADWMGQQRAENHDRMRIGRSWRMNRIPL